MPLKIYYYSQSLCKEERGGGPAEAKTTRQNKCKTRVSRKEGKESRMQAKEEGKRKPEEGRREGEGW